ncbi:hypothetical protein H0O02_01570 [Candidatus Micrarchaeota archaeon]|nr:hypothetical protein [Candidatus Micrarchaeota archaeon]
MNEDKIIGEKPMLRCVARTMNIEEANAIAERYEAEGYETEIVKRKRGEIAMYEVWIGGEPKGLYAGKRI